MTTSAPWLAEPRTTSPEIAEGLLRLSDPGAYQVIEVDVDGTVGQVAQLCPERWNAQYPMRSADTPTTYAVAGFAFGRPFAVHDLARGAGVRELAQQRRPQHRAAGPGARSYAEDIAQGWRFDVYDSQGRAWYSLCARSGNPRGIEGYGIGTRQRWSRCPPGTKGGSSRPSPSRRGVGVVAGVPAGDAAALERLVAWWHPGPASTFDDLRRQPGKRRRQPAPSEAQLPDQIEYAATPGTLPTLRFARSYRFRARVVDLAGNSVPFDATGPTAPYTTDPVCYGRVEPVASPVIVPCAPRTPGESLETIVIRSNYDIADSTVVPCQAAPRPARIVDEMAETHGALDSARPPEQGLYAMLAGPRRPDLQVARDLAALRRRRREQSRPQRVGLLPVRRQRLRGPLPARRPRRGVSLLGLPGAGSDRVNLAFDTGWPDRRAIRLVVRAGSGTHPAARGGELDGPLTVHAPKASVTTVRLSSWFVPAQLASMKLWQWLTEAGLATPELDALIRSAGTTCSPRTAS